MRGSRVFSNPVIYYKRQYIFIYNIVQCCISGSHKITMHPYGPIVPIFKEDYLLQSWIMVDRSYKWKNPKFWGLFREIREGNQLIIICWEKNAVSISKLKALGDNNIEESNWLLHLYIISSENSVVLWNMYQYHKRWCYCNAR